MITKEEFEAAKRELNIGQLKRRETLAAWNEYTGFFISKLCGLVAAICGGLDLIYPSLIPHIPHPEMFLGTGLAILTGKTLITKLARTLE
jgi:hypothetical protein